MSSRPERSEFEICDRGPGDAGKRLVRTLALPIATALLILGPGCQQGHKPTDRETVVKNWNDTRASVLYSLAQDQYKGHDFDACRETCDQALKMAPDSAPLRTLAAKVDIEQGRLELAEKELELARKYSPNEPEPHYLSGVIFQRWQKPQTALEFYRPAGQRAPAELAYVLAQGEMLVTLDRRPEALTLLRSKVAYFENSATIRDAVGQLLLQSGRYAEAADMLRQASVLSEDDDAVRERLAMAYYDNKQYREAFEVLSRLTQKEPYSKRADLFELEGECQMNLADPHGARLSFDTATDLNPYSAATWRSLGRAALESGDLRHADMALRRSIVLDGSASETHLLIGYVRVREGNLPAALASFQKASSLDPRDTVSLCMIGYAYEKMGKSADAARCYEQALKINPGDELASELLAGAQE